MNASSQHQNFRRLGRTVLAVIPLALVATACQATIHTRWANTDDTYNNWVADVASMPMDIHGQADNGALAQAFTEISQATTAAQYAVGHPAAPKLQLIPRVVLYVDGDQIPTDGTYCSASPVMRTVENKEGKSMVAAALCDGSRLVDRVREDVTPNEISASNMPHTLDQMKSKLLFGLTVSQAHLPDQS